jgi:hypothetical protein
MINFAEIRERAEKAAEATGGEWILGGCSGRMITTPDGYVGDGFIADVDIKENANHIATANPQTVIALLDYIDKMKGLLQEVIDASKIASQVTFGGNMHRYEMYVSPDFISDAEKFVSPKEPTNED